MTWFTGVVPVNQVALVTVGEVSLRPAVEGRGLVVAPMFTAVVTADHRRYDGADSARLLSAFAENSGSHKGGAEMSTQPDTAIAAPSDSRHSAGCGRCCSSGASRNGRNSSRSRGKIPGGVHPAVGQEATAVGMAAALTVGDTVSASHRGHHHALAKGVSANGMMAELYGKSTGVSGGRGGSMHLAGFEVGFIGSNGIVGASAGIALGDAFAAHYRGEQRVAVGFFGDGGINTGRTWEFLNLAAAWRLPLIAVCENNLYAVETPTAAVTGGGSMTQRRGQVWACRPKRRRARRFCRVRGGVAAVAERSPVMGRVSSSRSHTDIRGTVPVRA